MKSHDAVRWSISERDSTEITALACQRCGSDLALHQPDPQMPERILGTCGDCKSWFLLDGESGCVQIVAGEVTRERSAVDAAFMPSLGNVKSKTAAVYSQ